MSEQIEAMPEMDPPLDPPSPHWAARRWARLPRWLWLLIGLLVVVAVVVVVRLAAPHPFESAISMCGLEHKSFAASVEDGGRTLVLDNKGKEDLIGLEVSDLACVFKELDMPMSVIAKMDATRALDGRQSDHWDGYSATWSYHPDSGLDVIIER